MTSQSSQNPLWICRCCLDALGVVTTVSNHAQISQGPILLVSNHRSFMDPALLMHAIERTVHFAYHPYISNIPLLGDFAKGMGGFSLEQGKTKTASLFQTVADHLNSDQAVGLFPEGTAPMVRFTRPHEMMAFQRGFAHLALRSTVEQLQILPVAISAQEETRNPLVPLYLLSLFDPSEPLFGQGGWHPAIIYRRVQISIGQPLVITATERAIYQGRAGRELVREITATLEQRVAQLLAQGL